MPEFLSEVTVDLAFYTTIVIRSFVVRGRLWRSTNPALPEEMRVASVKQLMDARRAVKRARRAEDTTLPKEARAKVHAAKIALGERGPVWWDDGAPDFSQHMVSNTPYAEWYKKEHGESS